MKSSRVDCMSCRHHQITHDARFPYACAAMGFKSRRLPHHEVVAVTGEPCVAYQRREFRVPAKK